MQALGRHRAAVVPLRAVRRGRALELSTRGVPFDTLRLAQRLRDTGFSELQVGCRAGILSLLVGCVAFTLLFTDV
jgi:hypothetical protein